MSIKKIIIPCLLVLLLGSCAEKKQKASEPKAIPVKTMIVEKQDTPDFLQFSGNILPYKTVKFGFMVAGKVKAVHVHEGEYVDKHQLIAELDPTDYKFALDAAQAQFNEASKEYERLKKLYDKASLTKSNYDKIQAMYTEAKADYEYKLKQYQDTKVYAPDYGYIAVEGIEPGEIIPQGYPVFGLVHTKKVFAEASVPEGEIDNIKMGTTVNVRVPALGDSIFMGEISRIGQVADVYARAFPVKATLQNNDFLLKPGMIAIINVPSGQSHEQITIPANAVVMDANGQTYVFVVKADKVNKIQVLTAGATADEVIIQRGLTGGEEVVTEGRNKLFEGALVNVLND